MVLSVREHRCEEDVMRKKIVVRIVLFLFVLSMSACNSEPDPEYLSYLLSGTQTAMAAENAPTPTKGLGPDSRCGLFADEDLSVVLYSIYPWDTNLKMYVKFPDGVVGLEDGMDDGFPWEYTATLGDVESMGCDVLEGDTYAGRLYCIFALPSEYRNAAKPFVLHVNGCNTELLSIPMLSLATEKVAASGGSAGDSSSGYSYMFPGTILKLCGEMPFVPAGYYSSALDSWCNCMGGTYPADFLCDLP
jgi:hypothetical protein